MREHLTCTGFVLVVVVVLAACDILGADDDGSGQGLGPLGDTLEIDETITRRANFADFADFFSPYQHVAGRNFELRETNGGTVLNTDTTDDAIVTLSEGVPDEALLDTPVHWFGAGVTSSNPDADILEVEIRGSDDNGLASNFYGDLANQLAYDVVYIYFTADTEIGGINADPTDFDLSLSAGWNLVVVESTATSVRYTDSLPSGINLKWTSQTSQ